MGKTHYQQTSIEIHDFLLKGKILAPIPRQGRIEENRRFTMGPIVVGARLKLDVSRLKLGR